MYVMHRVRGVAVAIACIADMKCSEVHNTVFVVTSDVDRIATLCSPQTYRPSFRSAAQPLALLSILSVNSEHPVIPALSPLIPGVVSSHRALRPEAQKVERGAPKRSRPCWSLHKLGLGRSNAGRRSALVGSMEFPPTPARGGA